VTSHCTLQSGHMLTPPPSTPARSHTQNGSHRRLVVPPLSWQQTPWPYLRMRPTSRFFLGPSPILQSHSSLISISTPVASYEHEARKVLSALYVAHAILVEYDAHSNSLPLPSSKALSGCASIFAVFSGQVVDEIYFESSMNFRRSSTRIIHLLNLSSLPSLTRSSSHLLPPPTVPLSLSMS
jgi:hypothetical protein